MSEFFKIRFWNHIIHQPFLEEFFALKSIGCIRTESNKLILPLRRITKSFNSEDEVKNCISELRKLRDARIKPDEEIEKIINELKGTAIIEKA